MDFDATQHPHRRFNPLMGGDAVLVSPHRMKRPWLGQTEDTANIDLPRYDPKCYLCPGNPRTSGENNGNYKSTLVFSNDFPALLPPPGPKSPPSPHPLLRLEPVQGYCDVFIFHPRHDLTLARLNLTEIIKIIDEWKRVYQERGNDQGIKYVQIFENKGAMMGCSNPHPHGQIWSLSDVPVVPSMELRALRNYADNTTPTSEGPKGPQGKACLLCDYSNVEVGMALDEGRVVIKNDDWVVVVPWWAVWPFETLVIPYKRHVDSLLDLDSSETATLAAAISTLTVKYDNLFKTSFPYSMGVHQRPTPSFTGESNVNHDVAHLHLHFTPPLLRSATVRKFLVGFEIMGEPQRDLSPEQAAQRLRECRDVHYLNDTSTE